MDIQQIEKMNSYLSFKLGEEIFASDVSKVLNILEMVRITEVPQSPPYIKGVINLRGDVLPVVDTRIKFGLSAIEFTKHTCILVMDITLNGESIKIGALVDSVLEVMEISDSKLKPPPTIGDKYKTEFIASMIEFNDQFIMILDVDKVFTTDEIADLKDSIEPTEKDDKEKKPVEKPKTVAKKTVAKKIAPNKK